MQFDPMNPLADPLASQLLDKFFSLLQQRNFDACKELLTQKANNPSPALNQVTAYCWAITWSETNHWTHSEEVLNSLLTQTLHPQFRCRVLNEYAIVSEHLGRLDSALSAYRQALSLINKEKEAVYWAKVTKNHSICINRAYELGLVSHQQLLSARTDILTTIEVFRNQGQMIEEGSSWNELGATYKMTKEWPEAIACYEKNLSVCLEHNQLHSAAISRMNIGEALFALGFYREAEALLVAAVECFATENDYYEQADALTTLGQIYAIENRPDDALNAFDQAIHCVETVRRDLYRESSQIDFFATQTRIYGAKVEYCLRTNNLNLAFDCTEQARSRSLLESFSLSNLEPSPLIAPLRSDEAITRLPKDSVLLSFFSTTSGFVIFALSPSLGIKSFYTQITASQLANASFDERGRPRSLMPDGNGLLSYPWLLEKLFDHFFAPLLDVCKQAKQIILIPHGPLHLLPLHAALNRTTGKYLVDLHQIVYAPSATIFLEYLHAQPVTQMRSGCLAIAPNSSGLLQPYLEVQKIAQITNGLALYDQDATLLSILHTSPNYRFLHIASHGWFEPSSPLKSGVFLADGILTAESLLALPSLGLDFISVNTCDSGRAVVLPGDELLGLMRALLYKGAPSLCLSLWAIEDLSARIFMTFFYQELATAFDSQTDSLLSDIYQRTITKFRKLRFNEVCQLLGEDGFTSEQTEFILSKLPRIFADIQSSNELDSLHGFDHPYYWASFLLIGNLTTTKSSDSNKVTDDYAEKS